jgi:glutamate dehydrogenase
VSKVKAKSYKFELLLSLSPYFHTHTHTHTTHTMSSSPTQGAQAVANKLLNGGRLPTHLSVPGSGSSTPRIIPQEGGGYVAPTFEGKEQQMESVMDGVEEKGFVPADLVEFEVKWFYNELGIDDMYFATESVEAIVTHIHSLYAAKVAAYARDDKRLEIRLDKEADDHAVYIDTSKPGISVLDGPRYEQRIDTKYLNVSKGDKGYHNIPCRELPLGNTTAW